MRQEWVLSKLAKIFPIQGVLDFHDSGGRIYKGGRKNSGEVKTPVGAMGGSINFQDSGEDFKWGVQKSRGG